MVMNEEKLKIFSKVLTAQFKYLLSAYSEPGTMLVHKVRASVLKEINQKRHFP